MMPGMIMLWYGSVATIPSGWHLCDGTMGTPDLRDLWVVGAGSTYNPGATGGAVAHDHFWSSGYFYIPILTGEAISSGAEYDERTDYHLLEGDTEISAHRPPYHALCYIMKLN